MGVAIKDTKYKLWDEYNGKKLLLIAVFLTLLVHGILIYFTLPGTYDAFVHIFFADHYKRFWFEPWEYRWYTGYLTVSYPPLIHQSIAFLSNFFPLKVSFSIFAVVVTEVFAIGIYRFSKMFYSKTTAGIAAIVAVLMSSIVETMHVYGQLPTMTGLAFLLNSLPFIYQYVSKKKPIYLFLALSFLAVVITSHHVTAIFGLVFFIAPVIFTAITDQLNLEDKHGRFPVFIHALLKKAMSRYKEIILFGGMTILLAVSLIFPYWYWSKTDPITQVPIPHGSRDNFLEVTSSGLIFFIIPLLPVIAFLPAILVSLFKDRRLIGWTVSFLLCLLLGSGGTTPLPRLILGDNAFNILTLDRFGFWASIISIPFIASFIHSFLSGDVFQLLKARLGKAIYFAVAGFTGLSYILFIVYIIHLGSFRPLQPKEIDIEPITNFLDRDEHNRWRYLTLGFGDQMAWLSANTLAATVDGNYHSARRLPELTSRPIERLENAKYMGNQGLSSLEDFLTYSEKYALKYVFSNDRYYDPLLFYTGWSRTLRLENGIMVWEKGNISPVKPLTYTDLNPFLKNMWGIVPFCALIIVVLFTFYYLNVLKTDNYFDAVQDSSGKYPPKIAFFTILLPLLFFSMFMVKQLHELLWVEQQNTPENAIAGFYIELDYQRFDKAYQYFKPTPIYPLSQYLLEKSVLEGGLLPSYAKLDSLNIIELYRTTDAAKMEVNTRWRTSLGYRTKCDTIQLVKQSQKWFIIPREYIPEIPDYQMRKYTFTLYKKQGKRLISSFPTVKDDRVKKPFASFKQANLIKHKNGFYITGEILNADDIPVNMALKAVLTLKDNSVRSFYTNKAFRYNLAPKASSYFQIDMPGTDSLDLDSILDIALYTETDVSERGYIHGGVLGYNARKSEGGKLEISALYYNDLSVDINIPGMLIAHKNNKGEILKSELKIFADAVRSGLHYEGRLEIESVSEETEIIVNFPLKLFINGTPRGSIRTLADQEANRNAGVAVQPHCYISEPIYLQ